MSSNNTPPLSNSDALTYREQRLTGEAGHSLFVREYPALTTVAAGQILLVHGVAEHGGRYNHVARRWQQAGFRVIVPDLGGHGRSSGVRCDVVRFEDYLGDLEYVAQTLGWRSDHDLLFGHSMGGLLALMWAMSGKCRPKAIAVTSPALEVIHPISNLRWLIGRLLNVVAPRTRFATEIRGDELTRHPDFLAQWKHDALIEHHVTARWYFALCDAMQWAQQNAAALDVPTLFVVGEADPLVSSAKAMAWLERTRAQPRKTCVIAGAKHEVLNDIGWEQTAAEIADWFVADRDSSVPNLREPR